MIYLPRKTYDKTPSACHQVHDAIYSKQLIDPVTIENRVLEEAGFKIEISTD